MERIVEMDTIFRDGRNISRCSLWSNPDNTIQYNPYMGDITNNLTIFDS